MKKYIPVLRDEYNEQYEIVKLRQNMYIEAITEDSAFDIFVSNLEEYYLKFYENITVYSNRSNHSIMILGENNKLEASFNNIFMHDVETPAQNAFDDIVNKINSENEVYEYFGGGNYQIVCKLASKLAELINWHNGFDAVHNCSWHEFNEGDVIGFVLAEKIKSQLEIEMNRFFEPWKHAYDKP